MHPPFAKKCFRSDAYARFVASDWLAATKWSAAAEKPLKTASIGFAGNLAMVAIELADCAAGVPAFLGAFLVILKCFLAVDNGELLLIEVERKFPKAPSVLDVPKRRAATTSGVHGKKIEREFRKRNWIGVEPLHTSLLQRNVFPFSQAIDCQASGKKSSNAIGRHHADQPSKALC